MKHLVIAMGLLTPFSLAHAAGLDVRIGDDVVGIGLQSSLANEAAETELMLLRNDDKDTTLLSAGLFVTGDRGGIKGHLGVKAYGADLDWADGYGLALGGDLIFPLAAGIAIESGLFYGPEPLTASDLDNYQEWYIGASYEVFDNAKLAAGIGSLELETDNNVTVDVEDGVFVEMSLRF